MPSNYNFSPSFNETDNYTFYPNFEEYVTLYRGVIRIWIGDGETTGDPGFLYAEYVDGLVQRLGYVSDYAEAKSILEDQGIDLSYSDWVTMLLQVPTNATQASAAAAAASVSEKNAEKWATGNTGGTATSTNNAKYYSQQASSSASSASSSASSALGYKNAAEIANSSAQTAKTNSESANTAAQTAKTSAEAAEAGAITAKEASEAAQASAEAANTSAITAKNEAIAAKTNSETARDAAVIARQNSESFSLDSEAWAKGTRNGSAVSSTDPAYQNNAKYYAESSINNASSAAASASNAATSEANSLLYKNSAEQAKTDAQAAATSAEQKSAACQIYANRAVESADTAETYAVTAETYADEAHGWAIGNSSGSYSDTNNAKYYSEQAEAAANSIKQAKTETTYKNGNNGTRPPGGPWSASPNPVKGQYVWTKTDITWSDNSISTIYNVSYVGVDGTGSVNSVNTKVGDVVLYANDLTLNSSTSETIEDRLEIASIAEIDALFA